MGESGRSRWSDSAGVAPVTYLAWRFLNGTLSSVKYSSLCGWLHEKEYVIIVVITNQCCVSQTNDGSMYHRREGWGWICCWYSAVRT